MSFLSDEYFKRLVDSPRPAYPTVQAAQTLPSGTIDTDVLPKDNGVCANCWNSWASHVGWRCPNFSSKEDRYSKLPEHGRYRTGCTRVPSDAEDKPTDWRTWRDHGKAADECPCGARWGKSGEAPKPGECRYHRR